MTVGGDRRIAPDTEGVILERSEGSGRCQHLPQSEILHFVQNDGRWRGTCFVSEVLTYGQSEVCYASEVFAKAKVKFRLWRSDNQACVSLCL